MRTTSSPPYFEAQETLVPGGELPSDGARLVRHRVRRRQGPLSGTPRRPGPPPAHDSTAPAASAKVRGLMGSSRIADVLAGKVAIGEPVAIEAWVRTRRDSKAGLSFFDMLDARLDEVGLPRATYGWYRDLRRYGTVPDAGFGLGVERAIQYLTGLENIRETIPFPRMLRHADF